MKQGDVTTQDEAVILPTAFVGTFTRDTTVASGTQGVTGVGFKPSAVIFFSNQDISVEFSIGLDDGVTAKGVQQETAGSFALLNTFSIRPKESPGNQYGGSIQSFDSDGFTIIWTKTGSPSGTITMQYMAFK